MKTSIFEGKYCASTCPVCSGPALEAEIALRKAEFQCSLCGAFEITPAACSAMKGLSQENREVWLSQARRQGSTIPLIVCANEPMPHLTKAG